MPMKSIVVSVAGHEFEITEVPYSVRENGEHVIGADVTGRIQLKIASEFARRGIVNGGTFKAIRKALRFKSVDLAHLLGVMPETISRWEAGALPMPRPSWVAVAALLRDTLDGRDEVGHILEAASKPHVMDGAVSLPLAA